MILRVGRSINNIFRAYDEGGNEYECRIKGKILKTDSPVYTPVVVGDYVEAEKFGESCLITSVIERKSSFERWNHRRNLNQVIAANQDITVIVVSSVSPAFKPFFLDRAIACSHNAEILIVFNKDDLSKVNDSVYKSIGFDTMHVSALFGMGLDELTERIMGKTAAFVGQSGVGKSSLVNKLTGSAQKVSSVSGKYNRGRHTTNHSLLIEGRGFSIIDTPGVREMEVPFEDVSSLFEAFPEIREADCKFPRCTHTGEDGCSVPSLVKEGLVSAERYESYLRMVDSIKSRIPFYMRKGNEQKGR